MNPKILVGCPTSEHKEYALDRYANAVKNLTYPNYDILLVDNSETNTYYEKIKSLGIPVIKDKYQEKARDRIVHSRNILRNHVIKNNYDYLLSLEQDVIPPKDIIERLLKHNKKVISALYFVHNPVPPTNEIRLIPLAYIHTGNKNMRILTKEEIWEPQLLRIVSCGLGAVLIHISIVEQIKFRYDPSKDSFDDRWFAIDLFDKAIPMYCDNTIKCLHLLKGRIPWRSIKK